jgi:membrane fusion protein (multidrug efflux system)
MAVAFRQTLAALSVDARQWRRRWAVVGAALVLASLWAAWFALAEVPIYAVSESARVQSRAQVHPVDVLVAGRVVSVSLPVGKRVRAGEALLVLDTTDVSLRLEEARARATHLEAQIAAVKSEIDARLTALAEAERGGAASLAEAQMLVRETSAAARLAAKESERAARLHRSGVVAAAERDRASATLAQQRAARAARGRRVEGLRAGVGRQVAEDRAETASLEADVAALESERARASVDVRRIEEELARHTVRAPIEGRLGEIRAPQLGSVVAVGQRIASITPEGDLHIVADFAPSDVIGRLRAGQPAHMRVTGFPWTEYGLLEAAVTAVASEPLDGRIRVELALARAQTGAIPLRHGLVGRVEIVVEELSPAELVARTTGRLVAE